jgi:hypothetical protein
MIITGPKGQYVQKGPATWAITCKNDQLEGPLRAKVTSWKGHYTRKEILNDKNRSEGLIRSERTGQRATKLKMDRSKGPLSWRFFLWSGAFSKLFFKFLIFQILIFKILTFKILIFQDFDIQLDPEIWHPEISHISKYVTKLSRNKTRLTYLENT